LQRKTGRPCLVCSHPDHDEIDAAIVQNSEKFSKLSARFKVSIGSLQRHRDSHLPARLLNTAGALQAAADAEFVRLAVTQSASRLRRIQTRADQLESIRAARAAAADPAVPGADTGLLVTRRRSIRTGKDEYELVQDVELDSALLAEERALERAAAMETGEYLAQTGRGSFGAAGGVNGPLVIVMSSGLQPLPGDGPGVARHRITDPRRRASATAAAAGVPLGMGDIDQAPEWIAEDTRQPSLSGMVDDLESDDGPAWSLEDDAGDAAG